MNNLITEAARIPVSDPVQTISTSPVTLSAPGRGIPLELRITAPSMGRDLPIILLSHGHGPSLYIPSKDGYGPLVSFYAEHGFAVIQPTHLNSKVAGLPPGTPGRPLGWKSRVEDMALILDRLDEIETQAPALADRLDRTRIAVVGHSLGGQTAGMLLGARLSDPKDAEATDVSMIEPRIKAGVIMAAPGNAGPDMVDMSDAVRENISFLNPDFTHMTTRNLVVIGENDVSPHLTTRDADWHADPFHDGPGSDALLTLIGGKHGMGGISGYDAKEADDEHPERLAVVQRMTWAYLRSALYEGDPAWQDACAALQEHARLHGRVDFK